MTNSGRQPFGAYARAWLRDHPKIGAALPGDLHAQPATPHGGARRHVPLRATHARQSIREWYAAAHARQGRPHLHHSSPTGSCGPSWTPPSATARSPRTPANIPGAGTDRAKERPVASVAQVVALIEAITPRYRAAVLLGAWCGLRRGEIIALTPQDIDLDAGTVTVRTNRVELLETRQAFDAPPKTDAGKRTVTVPPHVLPILAAHMEEWSGPDRVFIGRDGKPMRGDAVRQAFARARRKVGHARLPVPRPSPHWPDPGRLCRRNDSRTS